MTTVGAVKDPPGGHMQVSRSAPIFQGVGARLA